MRIPMLISVVLIRTMPPFFCFAVPRSKPEIILAFVVCDSLLTTFLAELIESYIFLAVRVAKIVPVGTAFTWSFH